MGPFVRCGDYACISVFVLVALQAHVDYSHSMCMGGPYLHSCFGCILQGLAYTPPQVLVICNFLTEYIPAYALPFQGALPSGSNQILLPA